MTDPLDEIRTRIDLVELVSDYVRLERSGKNFRGLCPFHADRNPSFTVSPALGRFHCFGCGASGDLFAFLMRIEGIGFPEAVQKLAQKAGVHLGSRQQAAGSGEFGDRLKRAVLAAHFYFRHCLKRSSHAQVYLQKRGLTEASIEKFGLGYAPDLWDGLVRFLQKHHVSLEDAQAAGVVELGKNGYYDRFRARIIFPIHDSSGRVVAFGGRILGTGEPKYLNSPETPLFEKRTILYGWHLARGAILKEHSAILVEGYLDLITLHQSGFENAIATLGTAFTEEHAQRLKRLVTQVYLAYDSDEAGVKAALRAAEILQEQGIACSIVALPPEEDPDTLLRREGTSRFQTLLDSADRAPLFALKRLINQFDLTSQEGQHALLQAALPILASVPTAFQREPYIQWLVDYTTKLMHNEGSVEALREEVRRFIRKQRQSKLATSERDSLELASTGIPRAVIAAERTLLRAACTPEYRQQAWEFLKEPLFQLPAHRAIAQHWTQTWLEPPTLESSELIALLPDETLQGTLTALLLNEEEPLNAKIVIDCATYLRQRQKKARRTELLRLLNEGKLLPDDPEWQEYLQLLRGDESKVQSPESKVQSLTPKNFGQETSDLGLSHHSST